MDRQRDSSSPRRRMLCYVSMPDCVLTEFKVREKARGQDLLEAVRLKFSTVGSKSTDLLSTEYF